MIPIRLRLRNFMCYRDEQSLDFSGIHLACLAGDNGHGKSTLLDAMTWALWGKARARRDDELITLGSDIDEMWVDYEFGLGGQRYRVWRQRSKRGRGQSDLHFYVWNEAGNDWQILDEGGLLERQRQITRTLRMEYETFVNSAFVLQGRADSFTVKTPAERKEILADILGLSLYDLYEARAKEESQTRKERAGRLQGEIAGLDNELSNRQTYEAQLAEARAVLAEAVSAREAAEEDREQHNAAVLALRAKRGQLVALRSRLARARSDLEALQRTLANAEERLTAFRSVLARREEIEQGWHALETARQQDETFGVRLREHSQFDEQANRIQREIDAAQSDLAAERRGLEGRRQELARKVQAGVQQAANLAEAQAALTQMRAWQERRDEIAAARTEFSAGVAAAEADQKRAQLEGKTVSERIALLESAETATCPLCEQPLTADHRARMQSDLQAERAAWAEAYLAAKTALTAYAEQRQALAAEDRDLEARLRARDARQAQAARAESAITEAQEADAAMAGIAAEIGALEARLSAGDFAHDARERLARVRASQAAVGYDAAAHQLAHDEAARLAPFAALYQGKLLPALDGVRAADEQVQTLTEQTAGRVADLADDAEAEHALDVETAGLPAAETALTEAGAAVDAARAVERRARLQEGGALQRLEALASLAERRASLQGALEAANAEIGLFNELREAFGKKGLQAMIIESAIPEVETEANVLLNRMTEGRMSLRLETQREKVTGGVAETLDIIIADELGSRAYEMYSGGEAFRANLALRIAISKLLARRAGAQLQTLVIDEGFGTQDTQGRGLLVEAINSIQEDFERIIVITHIEELKDLFPARIDVVKTPLGSRINVN